MAGDHTSASSDSSIKFDVGVLSAGITITARARSDVTVANASRTDGRTSLLLDDPIVLQKGAL